jgi:hypothetical protein
MIAIFFKFVILDTGVQVAVTECWSISRSLVDVTVLSAKEEGLCVTVHRHFWINISIQQNDALSENVNLFKNLLPSI